LHELEKKIEKLPLAELAVPYGSNTGPFRGDCMRVLIAVCTIEKKISATSSDQLLKIKRLGDEGLS